MLVKFVFFILKIYAMHVDPKTVLTRKGEGVALPLKPEFICVMVGSDSTGYS